MNSKTILASLTSCGVLFSTLSLQEKLVGDEFRTFNWEESQEDAPLIVKGKGARKRNRDKGTSTNYNNFEDNPYTTKEQKKRLRPYLLPSDSPLKPALDAIFTTQRATADENAFMNAGFTILARQPRSFIVIGRHPSLPGYLVKAYLDTEIRKKRNKESWVWFANRCKGALKIEKVIERYHFTKFTVPKKWIYPLPLEPAPLLNRGKRRYNEVLVVTDMKLAAKEESLNAWKNVSRQDLDALYTIMCCAGGSSYREDNIPYTQNGTFAFIDTEYPDKIADFRSIIPYLSDEMQTYWLKLVKKGGPNF
jgi:hypothetical protein